jgi:hypothetical protein
VRHISSRLAFSLCNLLEGCQTLVTVNILARTGQKSEEPVTETRGIVVNLAEERFLYVTLRTR